MSLEQVLNPQPEETVEQPEVQAQEQSGASPEGGGEPTSPETQNQTHVPLAALDGYMLRTLTEVDQSIAAEVAAAAAGRRVPVLSGYVGRLG